MRDLVKHNTIVLFGGDSDERHVSVASAQNVVRTLGDVRAWFWAPDGSVHDVTPADLLAHQRPFEIDFDPPGPATFTNLEAAIDSTAVDKPVFLLALHGGAGEDGTVQRLLEERAIPFTGSGAAASEASFDKERAKELVRGRCTIAESRVARGADEVRTAIDDMLSRHERIVLKPLAAGSSRGLFFLDRGDDRDEVVDKIAALSIPYLVEQFISGRELTVGVVADGGAPFALPVIEIVVEAGHSFDYEGKYLGKGTREICPADIPDAMRDSAQNAAVTAHVALGCDGYSRSDFVATEDGGMYFLELNTLPGLTTSSLVPQELTAAGIDFRDFLENQIDLAVERTERRRASAGDVARPRRADAEQAEERAAR